MNETAEQRLSDAAAIGADIAAVERLNMLERQKIVADFNTGITNGFLALGDPLAAQLAQQEQTSAQRLADARILGADITAVERLNMLERKKIVDTFNQSISKSLLQITNPLLFALDNIADASEQRLTEARLLGVSLVEVEALNAAQRRQVIEDSIGSVIDDARDIESGFGDAMIGIQNFIKSMNLADNSPLTPAERLASAQSQYDQALSASRAGDITALQNITDVAQQLIDEGASYFSGTQGFIDIFETVASNLDSLTGMDEPTYDPVVSALEEIGIQGVTNTVDIIDAINNTTASNEQLAEIINEFLDSLTQVISGADV